MRISVGILKTAHLKMYAAADLSQKVQVRFGVSM
jgi:hypothetical protein